MSKYHYETASLDVRLKELRRQEDELTSHKEEYVKQKNLLEKEYEQVRLASQQVQQRSEEVEEFAKVSVAILQWKGMEMTFLFSFKYVSSFFSIYTTDGDLLNSALLI